MRSTTLFSVALLFVFFSGSILTSQEVDLLEEDVASPFAVTVEEKAELLKKAEATLLWFRGMGRETRAGVPPAGYRKMILPIELMQAAAILKSNDKADLSRMLREMLPFFQPTPEECFEIEERLGAETLDALQEDKEFLQGETVDSTTRIREGAARFLKERLRPTERFALIDSPESASELMKAINLLAVSGRPMVTRHYLRRFLETEAEPEEYARIAESIGSRNLMQIAGNVHLQPQGKEAVGKIYAEAKKFWRDPETVAQALEQFQSSLQGTGEDGKLSAESLESMQALWRGSRVSAAQLIERLAATEDRKEADELLAVLLSLGGDVKEALSESFQSDNPKLLEHAARGLASVASRQEAFLFYPLLFSKSPAVSDAFRNTVEGYVVRLLGQKPAVREAVATLYSRADDYDQKNRPLKADADGYVRFWNWDEKEQKAKYIRMTLPAAYRLFACRYATQAFQIAPDDLPEQPAVRRLYLATRFERTAYLNGRDTPLGDASDAERLAGDADSRQLERILVDSIQKKRYAAAQIAALLLGRKGDARSLLLSDDGKPRPLTQAAVAPDRRVRFAALEAIMTLKPDTPFPGSSLVTETLVWFSRADGRRILISAHPKQSVAARTAGYFIPLGYKGELAVTCREAMHLAVETPDVEMIVVDLQCSRPSVPNFVQAMRSDYRTHDVPIAVLTDDPKALDQAPNFRPLPTMEKVDRSSPDNPFGVSLSQIYPHVVDEDGARWLHDDLFEKTGADPIPPEVRLEQARKSLLRLKEIVADSENCPKIYHIEDLDDTIYRALRSEARIDQGLELAGAIRSGAMQAAIYEVVAESVYPMELRKRAADVFAQSIERFGILLRGKQVGRLYDCYNASESESKEVQELLSRMIDLIEDKTFEKQKK